MLLLIGRENPNAQASAYVTVDWKGKSKRSGFRLRNKMAWNDQRSLESGSKSLLNKFEFLNTLLIECNAPLKIMLLYVGIVVVAVVITELAWLKKKKEDVLLRPAPRLCRLAGVVLQRIFLAPLTVLLVIKTLKMSWYGS